MARVQPSVINGGISGKAGTVVFVRQANGSVTVRPRTTPRNPRTPNQEAWRGFVARAGRAFRDLDEAEYLAWAAYAREQVAMGRATSPYPSNAFTALAAKFLQVNPSMIEPPRLPPTEAFGGDAVRVTVAGEPGGVRFSADRANAVGVVTELLLCPLRSRHEVPRPRSYRGQGFVVFGSSLSKLVTALPGPYACAVRFVRSATGQASEVLVVGRVVVS